jgi:hypothetical protein
MALAELTEENKPNSLNCSNKTFFIHCYKFSHDSQRRNANRKEYGMDSRLAL